MASEAFTVFLIDEDALLRRGLGDLLEASGIRIAGEAASAEETIAKAAEPVPDVIVMALSTRGASRAAAVRMLCRAEPELRVMVLTDSSEPADAEAAIRAGAGGYMLKDDSPGEIVAAIRAIASGGFPLSPRVAGGVLSHLRAESNRDGEQPTLTARERNVLDRLAAGRRNTEIAADLAISVYTVKRHVSHLLAKLGVENRTEAAIEASRRGLL